MIIYSEKGYGLHKMLAGLGIELRQVDGIWVSNAEDTQVSQLIADYNPWPNEKSAKFAEIDQAFEVAVSNLTAGWPPHEIQTWSKQETEARALVTNPNAITPMLSTIASTRGMTAEQLALRVIRDADAFTAASAHYVGLRHKARQSVQALPDSGDYQRLPELWAIKFGDS